MAPSTARSLSPRGRKIAATATTGLIVALSAGAGLSVVSGSGNSEVTAAPAKDWPAPSARYEAMPLPRANQ